MAEASSSVVKTSRKTRKGKAVAKKGKSVTGKGKALARKGRTVAKKRKESKRKPVKKPVRKAARSKKRPAEDPEASTRKRSKREESADDSSETESESESESESSSESDTDSLTPLEFTTSRTEGAAPTVPRTAHVPKEYFSISHLLLDSEGDEDEKENKKIKKVTTFYQWIACFHTVMSIRLKFFPDELQGMIRHTEIVQDLCSQGKDFIAYDRQFRKDKAQWPEIKWGEYLHEIVNKLPRLNRQQPSQSSQQQGQGQRVCFRYNSPGGCRVRQCRWVHRCRSCFRLGHSSQTCFARNPPRNGQNFRNHNF